MTTTALSLKEECEARKKREKEREEREKKRREEHEKREKEREEKRREERARDRMRRTSRERGERRYRRRTSHSSGSSHSKSRSRSRSKSRGKGIRSRPMTGDRFHDRSRNRSRDRSSNRSREKSRDSSRDDKGGFIGAYTNSSDPALLNSRVFIGKLPTDKLSRTDLEDMFGKYGPLLGVSLHKGYGFVQFKNEEDAKKACEEENDGLLKGNKIDVKLAIEGKKENRRRRSPTPPHRHSPRRSPPPARRHSPPPRSYPERRYSLERDRALPPERDRDRDLPSERDRIPPSERDRIPPSERDRIPPSVRDRLPPSERDRLPPPDRDRGYPSERERSPLRDPYRDPYRRPPIDEPYRRGIPPGPPPPRDPYYDRFDPYRRDPLGDPYRGDPYRDRGDMYRDPYRDRIPPPSSAPPERAPVDCEIILLRPSVRDYAEMLAGRLRTMCLLVYIRILPTEDALVPIMEDVQRHGLPFAIVLNEQNETHKSLTLNILHGVPQEHRNMPLEDAMNLVARNFEVYRQTLRDRAVGPMPPAPRETPDFITPDQQTNYLLHLLADNRFLTVDELDRVIRYLQERRDRLVISQGGALPPRNGIAQAPSDGKGLTEQQLQLQQQIMNVLNPPENLLGGKMPDEQAANPFSDRSQQGNPAGAPASRPGDNISSLASTINFDNPSVQRALDNLISGASSGLLKNMASVSSPSPGPPGGAPHNPADFDNSRHPFPNSHSQANERPPGPPGGMPDRGGNLRNLFGQPQPTSNPMPQGQFMGAPTNMGNNRNPFANQDFSRPMPGNRF